MSAFEWNKRSVNHKHHYYGKPTERFARLMESILSIKSGGAYALPRDVLQTRIDDTLASLNVKNGVETSISPAAKEQLEAYPTREETEALIPAFDEFFNALHIGTNQSTGATTLFRMAPPAWAEIVEVPTDVNSLSLEEIKRGLKTVATNWHNRGGLVYKSEDELNKIVADAKHFLDTYYGKELFTPDGVKMVFAPDRRAIERLGNTREAWKEYAIHTATHNIGEGKRRYFRSNKDQVDRIQDVLALNKCIESNGGLFFLTTTHEALLQSLRKMAT